MFQFVNWLKAIAAVFITNSHYANIWPVSALAMGGHLGNCLFFLVSGFCLYQVKGSFPRWYLKRVVRIYPALWIAIVYNMALGLFQVDSVRAFLRCFFYPTWYHFIASILLLYILFYLWRWVQKRFRVSVWAALLATVVVYGAVYLFCFDKSIYHIDRVEENWVRFQFWASMLLGARLREDYDAIDNQLSFGHWAGLAGLTMAYFGAKVAFVKVQAISVVQCFLPVLIVWLVYQIALTAIKLEKQGFFAGKHRLNKLVGFLSAITLEIYLVQNVLIARLSHLVFPVNFVVVTGLILVVAALAHRLADRIGKTVSGWLKL